MTTTVPQALGDRVRVTSLTREEMTTRWQGRASAMIRMDGNDLMGVFEDRVALRDLLGHKRRAAHTGQVFIGTSPAMIRWGARPGLDHAEAAPTGSSWTEGLFGRRR